MQLSWPESHPLKKVIDALALGVLSFSWYACYLWLMGMTEGWGAPWDTAPIRPPLGHWQRTLNDFFESGIGMYLPTAIFLALQVFSYFRTLICTRDMRATSFVFGITNLVALVALLAIVMPIQHFLIHTPAHLTPEDWAYYGDFRREWPLTLVALVLFAGLLLVQPVLVRYTRSGAGS